MGKEMTQHILGLRQSRPIIAVLRCNSLRITPSRTEGKSKVQFGKLSVKHSYLLPSYTSSSIRLLSACQSDANIVYTLSCTLKLSAVGEPSKKRLSKRGTCPVHTPLQGGFRAANGAHPVYFDELLAIERTLLPMAHQHSPQSWLSSSVCRHSSES